jgi:uncharacterized protein YciI
VLFIYTIRPVRPEAFANGFTEKEKQRISDHFDYLKGLTGEGTVLLAGKTPNIPSRGFGIVILTAESEADARNVVDNDPAVRNNVFSAELFPFSIALSKGLVSA